MTCLSSPRPLPQEEKVSYVFYLYASTFPTRGICHSWLQFLNIYNDVFCYFSCFYLGVACISVSITDTCGNALQIKPEQKEIGYLDKKMKSDMEEITMAVTAENADSLPGIK